MGAADRIGGVATLADVVGDGFGGAAVAVPAVFGALQFDHDQIRAAVQSQ